jgi:hypothetical protein
VLYDEVRGGLFPFVHSGRLPFFRQIPTHCRVVHVPRVATLPDRMRLLEECASAVAAHNRRLPLLEAMRENAQPANQDWDRDLDIPVPMGMDAQDIEDVELLSLELVESHYVLVEVIATALSGELRPVLHSYSPFSSWEQDGYLHKLRMMESSVVSGALADLERDAAERMVRSIVPESGAGAEALWVMLTASIKNELGDRATLPDELVEKLHACEYGHKMACEAYDHDIPYRRESVVNDWGSLIELSLRLVAECVASCGVPADWRKLQGSPRDSVWQWYVLLASRARGGTSWTALPDRLKDNLLGIVRGGLPASFGKVRCSSSRDELARIMLAILAQNRKPTSPYVRRLALSIDSGRFRFEELDRLVDYRNDAAHGGTQINQQSEDEFLKTLTVIRKTAYDFLRQIFRDDANGESEDGK